MTLHYLTVHGKTLLCIVTYSLNVLQIKYIYTELRNTKYY